MPVNPRDEKYWRERAEEARAQADMLRDADAKREMLKVVAAYERLAERTAGRKARRE